MLPLGHLHVRGLMGGYGVQLAWGSTCMGYAPRRFGHPLLSGALTQSGGRQCYLHLASTSLAHPLEGKQHGMDLHRAVFLQLTSGSVLDFLNSGQPPLIKGSTSLMAYPRTRAQPCTLIGSKTYCALPNTTLYCGYLAQRGSSWGPTGLLAAGNYVGVDGSALIIYGPGAYPDWPQGCVPCPAFPFFSAGLPVDTMHPCTSIDAMHACRRLDC